MRESLRSRRRESGSLRRTGGHARCEDRAVGERVDHKLAWGSAFGVAAATSAPPPPASFGHVLIDRGAGDCKQLGDGANRTVESDSATRTTCVRCRPNPAIRAHPIHRSSEGLWSREQHNMCLLCEHHHVIVHRQGWHIRLDARGHPEFIPPKAVEPARTPLHDPLRK